MKIQKGFKPSQEMIEAGKTLFIAMAWAETVKPIVTSYEKGVLERHQWPQGKETRKYIHPNDKGNEMIILDPKDSYLLNDADFQVYLYECNEQRKAAGLKVESVDHCPLLVAEHNVVKAQRLLADTMEPVTDISADAILCSKNGLDNYRKYIELTLKLLAPFIKRRK